MSEDTEVEIKFAATGDIDCYEHLLPNFFTHVLDMDYVEDLVFVSDKSSLWDFTTYGQDPKANMAEIALFQARIEERYGTDVSDIEDTNLVKIFGRISEVDWRPLDGLFRQRMMPRA